ncbi:MAG: FAD-dependent oxidoreductase [Deltaproteobacteria bacterium]|nr:FAD-dependent oxidoreductase [Deltaproteobacteria bacterium]
MEGSVADKRGVDGSPHELARVALPGDPKTLARMANVKHRVVVLGGGFAGVYCAKYLTDMLKRRKDVHVELLSEENYFVFQPLLPEVAAGGVNANHVVNPIRDIVPKAQFRWSKVQSVDVKKKLVYAAQGEGKELVAVPYDHLVFALGKVSDFSSMPGVAEHGLAMKDLSDAFRLRNHVFRCLELADVEDDPEEKAALLTFVVAGGGFSGVETIGELAELLHKCTRQFHNIEISEIKLMLIHSRDILLPEMPEALGKAAEKDLRGRHVQMFMNARVKAATPQAVYLSTGDVLPTRTFICTVGNAPNPVVKKILEEDGFAEGKSKGRGIGVFEADIQLQCTGQTHYWAVGDCAGVPSPDGNGLCPATAQFAIRQAKTCANNILSVIDGKPEKRKNFSFKALGSLASLGNRSAVADMMGVKLTGFIAWFAWRTVYLSKLPGIVRRLRVTIDWTLDLFFPRDITQLQTMRKEKLRVDHYEPGEIIIEKNEIGRELYVIQKGEVEVYQPAIDGHAEKVITGFTTGDVFGEKALLTDTPRTASVRAKTAVNVLVVSRPDFLALVEQFAVLDDHFDSMMHTRYPDLVTKGGKVKELVQAAVAQSAPRGPADKAA